MVVGEILGLREGRVLGAEVGPTDGGKEGLTDGPLVGAVLGGLEGVGADEGTTLGEVEVGVRVGFMDG